MYGISNIFTVWWNLVSIQSIISCWRQPTQALQLQYYIFFGKLIAQTQQCFCGFYGWQLEQNCLHVSVFSYINSSLPYLVRKEKDTLIITRRHQQSLELEVVVHHHILDKLMRMANEHIVLLEILLIARNVQIINTDWNDKMTKETN